MTAASESGNARIVTLDFIRGVAVMGILLANLPAFALPEAAYFSPAAWGGRTPADIAAWAATFVLVEGKLRGLFTMLFGASALLVIERARATGEDAADIHLSRMAVLFVIGCAHLYLFWWGDILAHYAIVGALAFLFVRLPTRWLVFTGLALLVWQLLGDMQAALRVFASGARDTPQAVTLWNGIATGFGTPPPAALAAEIGANRSAFWTVAAWRWQHSPTPIAFALQLWPETLGMMLLGMAGLRSGFLTGKWPASRYRRCAVVCLLIGLPIQIALAAGTLDHGFDQRWVFLGSVGLAVLPRTVLMIGYAALLALACRPGGRLTNRMAAVGRTAFTNYLGTTLVMTAIFSGWGLGLFGSIPRAALYLIAPPVCLLMLAWSHPWLAAHRYGPLEWVWRILARRKSVPMRKARN